MSIFRKSYEFLEYELWRKTNTELTARQRAYYAVLKTIVLVVRGFISKDLNTRANALTYSLIFAIVPILAVVLAVAKGFGMADVIEDRLNRSFIGEARMVDTMMGFIDRYLETAQGGVFLGVGLIILLWAVYSFFRNVETAFNDIWNVQQSRSVLRQITTYIAILFLIPVLIIVSSGVSIFFNSAVESIPYLEHLMEHKAHTLRAIQWLTGVVIFTWMYLAIPNTKVRFWASIVPGILVGTLYALLQDMSVYVLMFLSRTSIVYGAFAAIPILLMWLQWTCLLMFIGAQMSYAIQNKEMFNYEYDLQHMSRRYKDYIMLYLLSIIIRRFENDEKPLTAHELAVQNYLPIRLVNQLLSRLIEVQIIRETYVEDKEEKTYLPALDTHKISVGMVLHRIDKQGTEEFLSNCGTERKTFWNNYLNIKKEYNSLDTILVSEIAQKQPIKQ